MLRQLSRFRSTQNANWLTGKCGESKENNAAGWFALCKNERNVCTSKPTEKWDLMSAVCLERHPIITKPLTDIEATYLETIRQIEFENSLKSDYELRVEGEKQKLPKSEAEETNEDLNIAFNQTTQEFEDACDMELSGFAFAPRISNAVSDNSTNSLRRKMEKNLVLLVKQKVGTESYWIPPQTLRREGETMRQAAHRSLEELCGKNVDAKFYGNAPIGFYKYRYPEEVRMEGNYGAKIFYFLAKYIAGSVSTKDNHCWLDREELRETLPPRMHRSISQFLLAD